MPSEYEEFLCLTHATKYASIASIAQTGDASAYLAHSLGLWILDSGAFDHLSGLVCRLRRSLYGLK